MPIWNSLNCNFNLNSFRRSIKLFSSVLLLHRKEMQEIRTQHLAICSVKLAIPECSQKHFNLRSSSLAPPQRNKALEIRQITDIGGCTSPKLLPRKLAMFQLSVPGRGTQPVFRSKHRGTGWWEHRFKGRSLQSPEPTPTVGGRYHLAWCSCRWISSLCKGRWVCTWASSPASCKVHSTPLWGLHCLNEKE